MLAGVLSDASGTKPSSTIGYGRSYERLLINLGGYLRTVVREAGIDVETWGVPEDVRSRARRSRCTRTQGGRTPGWVVQRRGV